MLKILSRVVGTIAAGLVIGILSYPLMDKINSPELFPGLETVIKPVEGKFPAMVQLTDLSGKFFCSGSVIADDMVLTAAHCISGEPLLIQSIPKAGEVMVARAVPLMKNTRADYGLVTGNFTGFAHLDIMVDPAQDVLYKQSKYVNCGFPWGSTPVCYPVTEDMVKFFDCFKTISQLYPGMSGGPVIDLKTGLVVAVNSAVGADGVLVCPIIGLYESIGR